MNLVYIWVICFNQINKKKKKKKYTIKVYHFVLILFLCLPFFLFPIDVSVGIYDVCNENISDDKLRDMNITIADVKNQVSKKYLII